MSYLGKSIEEIVAVNFQGIFDALPGNHLLIKADPPKFTIITACKNYIRMIGRPLNKLEGLGVFEAFPPNPDNPDDTPAADLLRKSFNDAITTKKQQFLPVYQYDLANEDNKNYVRKFWQVRNTPYLDEDGDVKFIINSVEDITERILFQRQQEELRPLKQSHNLYLQAPIGIAIFRGPELIVSLANNLIKEIWGKGKDVVGKSFIQIFPELQVEGYEKIMYEVMQKGIPKTFYEWPVILNKNGKLETGYYNVVYQPYYEEDDDSPVGILVLSDEVTEQVKAKKIIEENKLLELKNKELEQFAYIASHDLQEPLRKVNFYIQMLQDNLDNTNQETDVYIEKIQSASSRMSVLIKDILDFSKLSISDEQFKPCNLGKIIKLVLSDFEVTVNEKKATVEYAKMPVVPGIELHLRQLFHNLISNALKFSSQNDSPVIKITSEKLRKESIEVLDSGLSHDSDYYHIMVSDNGIGFDEEYAERIFGIFQRLHGKLEYQGTGIGLALCKKIVLSHNGKIWANSKEGVGTQIHILLPA